MPEFAVDAITTHRDTYHIVARNAEEACQLVANGDGIRIPDERLTTTTVVGARPIPSSH
jgi:hypothetical protein